MMDSFSNLDIDKITPDPNQPRKIFEDDSLTELSNSIKAIGVKQAIQVRKVNDKYMIIAGERRYRASILAGKQTIPAIIVGDESKLTEDALYAHQLTENLHREDLNPIEKAEFINKRMQYLISQGDENARATICEEIGVSNSWVSKALAPLKLEGELRQLVMEGKVKDYETVKKIKNLGDKKKKEAIEQINQGNFIAKEFFSRKKPIKDTSENINSEGEDNDKVESVQKKEQIYNFRLNRSQLDALFNSTGFVHTINNFDEEQKEILYSKNKKELVEKFIESITSS